MKMVRSLFAGGTSYQHQPTSEIVKDLNKMIKSAAEIMKEIDQQINRFPDKGYWDKVPVDFKGFVNSGKLLARAIIELKDMPKRIESKRIDESCVKRLRTLGRESVDLNKEIGIYWHQEYPEKYKDYNNPNFKVVDELYKITRGLFVEMMDLANIGAKLQDYELTNSIEDKRGILQKIFMNPWVYGVGVGIILWLLKNQIWKVISEKVLIKQ
jgi:hypothetical protein